MTEEADKLEEAAPLMEELASIIREEDKTKDSIEEQLQAKLFTDKEEKMFGSYVMSEHEEIAKLSNFHNINASEARKQLSSFPDEYIPGHHRSRRCKGLHHRSPEGYSCRPLWSRHMYQPCMHRRHRRSWYQLR